MLAPREDEREGYVPNVVYSCGSIILNGELIIPYAMSDSESLVASIPVDELLGKLCPEPLDLAGDLVFLDHGQQRHEKGDRALRPPGSG